MFMNQQRKSSTIRTVFLIIMFEFTFVEKSLSNKNICEDRNRGRIFYFTLHNRDVNWTEAWRHCNNNGSTLPVICNQQEHDAFIRHLRANGRHLSAWISARKITFDEWKWVDGQSYTSREVLDAAANEYFTRAYFDLARNHYTAAEPRRPRHYLCHYSVSGSSCMYENDIQVKNGCIRPSNDNGSWFDARNQCVGNGGDLAKVDDEDLVTLRNGSRPKLNAPRGYWIGLGNTTWRWMRHKPEPAHDSGEDVKYTNWGYNQPYASGECISNNASNGEWNSVACTERKTTVVCQISFGSDETTSRTSSSETTSMPTSSSEEPSTKIYSGLGAGIAILIICIIVIIFVVRYKRKPHKDRNHSKVENNSEQNGIDFSPNKPAASIANAPTNVPVNPLVAGTDEAQGVYADIALAPLNQSEDEAKIQQPGVLYAALEFQKDPTYLEPNHKNANASDQTKAGPMGDIYAIPDAKGRTGNEAASHPLLVTSQGDVYALPLKNSKSPTSNTPVGGIYANL